MKLVTISMHAIPRMPGMRPGDLATIECAKPGDALTGWRLSLRGQQAFLISPPGWIRDRQQRQSAMSAGTAVTIFEIPRAEITLQWAGTADEIAELLKSNKFDSEPFGPPPDLVASKPLLEQIPPGQVGDA